MIADCGHTYTPPGPQGGAAGYATDRETGATMCYPCADDAQRAELATVDRFTAYVGTASGNYPGRLTGHAITTWTGGKLGTVSGSSAESVRYTPTGGRWTAYAITVRMADGSRWYGTAQGPGYYVNLRRSKVTR